MARKRRRFGYFNPIRILGWVMAVGCIAAVLGAVGGYFLILYYSRDLPDVAQLRDYSPALMTRVYAADGRLVAEYAKERRVFVPIESMPPVVIHAFVAAEDQRFFEHDGLDYQGIARAAIENAKAMMDGGGSLQGASTITQQVVKNFLLDGSRELERKIKEAILALRMERAFGPDKNTNKRKILELYLNEINLGNRSYGVAAAALNYFDKGLDELTVAEAAFLAIHPKAPSRYQIERGPEVYERALDRRNYVLGRMLEDGYIDRATHAEAAAQPIELKRRRPQEFVAKADYFAEEVRRVLIRDFTFDGVYEGGLSVRTTLDPKLQVLAYQTLREGLLEIDRTKGYLGPVTSIDPGEGWTERLRAIAKPPGSETWQLAMVYDTDRTGAYVAFPNKTVAHIPLSELKWARPRLPRDRIGATISRASDVLDKGDVVLVEPMPRDDAAEAGAAGGDIFEQARRFPFYLRQIPEIQGALVAMDPHTGAVRAISGGFSYDESQFNRATQAMRQTGSSFKPFIFLAALEEPALDMSPVSLVDDRPFEIRLPDGKVWRPQNFTAGSAAGRLPMFRALERSLNLATVNLANTVGIDAIADMAERFGIYRPMRRQLAVALGAQETTVLAMTAAYGMLVNGGREIVPYFIERVQDRRGRLLWPRGATYGRRGQAEPFACQDCNGASFEPTMVTPDLRDRRPQIASPQQTFNIVTMLQGVITRGTARRINDIGKPVAGKTGTTNDYKDAWFVGFTPDLAVGVFVGYDDPRTIGAKATGGAVAAPIFQAFMKKALADAPATPFRTPPGPIRRFHPQTGQPCLITDQSCVEFIFPRPLRDLGSSLPAGGGFVGAASIGTDFAVPPPDFDPQGGDIY